MKFNTCKLGTDKTAVIAATYHLFLFVSEKQLPNNTRSIINGEVNMLKA